ncbi:MAG: hypothetical protein AB7G28_10235 [Pirellulales bacterium]
MIWASGWLSILQNSNLKVLAEMHCRRILLLAAISTLPLLFGGCGSGSPFEFVPVKGKVTYDDGTAIPLQGMRIYFHSLEPPIDGMHVRPGTGGVAADGTFKDITSYKFGDGLAYGKYKVSLVADERGKLTSKIPKDCAQPDKTPLQIEVTESGQFLEIKVPKP